MSASTIITLDQRRAKKDGRYPVKLRISYKGDTLDFPTVYDLTAEEFAKLDTPHPAKELREIRQQLKMLEGKSETLCREMRGFSFAKFEFEIYAGDHCLKPKKKKKESLTLLEKEFDLDSYKKRFKVLTEIHPGKEYISYVFSAYIQRLLQEERIGTALSYQEAYRGIKKFSGNVRFEDITVVYLVRLEKWMLGRGNSKTTVGIKVRCLRAIFNEAIFRKIIRKDDCYPFGRRQYMIPTNKKTKKALNLEDVAKIYKYETDDPLKEKARDYWLFCYMGNGMNAKDMAFLKNRNIEGDFINFERAKTERASRSNPINISVFISPELRAIIDKWSNQDKSPEAYLFPIMRTGLNMLEQHDLLNHFKTFINDMMGGIAKELGIEKKVTTVVSRHTFSTVLKRSGVSTEFIKDALGHSSITTTENYLDSFENSTKKQYAARLTNFTTETNDSLQQPDIK